MEELSRYLPKGFERPISDLAWWELAALERVAERPYQGGKRGPIEAGEHWAVAQTVTTMEHIVRREIEKSERGAFVPTYTRHWKIDGKQYAKEYPLISGYVFFLMQADDWAGIPDMHGVYDVLANADRTAKRVTDIEMARLVLGHAKDIHRRTDLPRYTKYYRPSSNGQFGRKPNRRRRPRPGKKLRDAMRA